ncbi:MAG: SGNH/GDSL hydrolase family protein [Monoglobaceae bacterium]
MLKHKFISFVMAVLMLFTAGVQVFAETVSETKLGMESRVLISGSLGSDMAGRTVTMFVTEKGADLSKLTPEQLWYIRELKTDDTGYYELLFEVDETKGAYDVYVNETGKSLEACTVSDYSESAYIETDVETARKDGVISLAYKIRNIFGYDNAKYDMITAYYHDGMLKNAVVNPIDLSNNTTSLSDLQSINVPDENEVNRIKFFILKKDSLQPANEATMVYNHCGPEFEYTTLAEETTIDLAADTKGSTYENYVKYSGRWAKNASNQMQGYWTRPYVEIRCDADVFKANIAGNFDLYVNGELAWRQYPGMSAGMRTYDFSPYLADGVSELMIIGASETYGIIIESVTLGAGSRLYVKREKDSNMLFIGDSITSAGNGYSIRVPMMTDSDFTTISKSASNLCDEHGVALYPSVSSGVYVVGHETQFDRLQTFQMIDTKDIENGTYTLKSDVGGDTPYIHHSEENYSDDNFDVVFFGLGTNDELQNSGYINDFKEDMSAFIQKLKALYPGATVVITSLLPSNGQTEAQKSTYKTRNENYKKIIAELQGESWWDERVKYFDMTELEVRYADTTEGEGLDTLHPHTTHKDGHEKIANIMVEWLKQENIID